MRTIDSNVGVCARIARRVEASVGTRRYSMWFDRSARFDYFDHQRRLEVKVPNQFVADWIGRNFQQHLLDALATEVGDEADLSVQIDTRAFDGTDKPTPEATTAAGSLTAYLPPPRTRGTQRYALEEFVVGPCNELAYEMARRLADTDGGAPTTLYVHGPCAVGKTHLLQGACTRYRQMHAGQARARYLTAEQFTNEFLTERRAERLDAFRRRVRRLDLLVIDDLGFLANKPGTQREVVAAMDEIESAGGRVLVAAHDHPKRLTGIDDKLISRCLRGVVARLDAPDRTTRVQIVRHLAQRRGIPLAEAIANVIASRCPGSIREIEGSLTKLHALANLTGDRGNGRAHRGGPNGQTQSVEIGHALVARLFASEVESAPRRVIPFETILTTVCEVFGVPRGHVLGTARHRQVVMVRTLVCYLAREMTSMSYPEIAAALGRRTHSTVIAATRRMTKTLKQPRTPQVKLPDCEQALPLAEIIDQLKYRIARR